MSQARRIETTLAASSLVAGFVANFTGLMLIGSMPWPLIAALVALGTTGLGAVSSIGCCAPGGLPQRASSILFVLFLLQRL